MTGPDRREVVSHVRKTRSLDRSSPRTTRRTDNNAASPANRARKVVKNLSRSPETSRKGKTSKIPENPLYSPETLGALQNAEKLIKEAQKKILEASYDVDLSPERSIESTAKNKKRDENTLYIQDIVAVKFHEANESARIFTRPSTRRPTIRCCRPETRHRRLKKIIEQCSEDSKIRRMDMRYIKSKISADEINKKKFLYPDKENTEKISSPISRMNETSALGKCKDVTKIEDQGSSKIFNVQEGPRVDIRNELSMTNIEKIDIEPRSLPVQSNVKTYEFCHGAASKRVDEPETNNSRSEMREKLPRSKDESSVVEATSSNVRGSRSDLVETESGRSIGPENPEGREDENTSRGVKQTREKIINREESFMDFLRRVNDKNKSPRENVHNICESPERFEARDDIDIFDRAVRQFFHQFGLDKRVRNQRIDVDDFPHTSNIGRPEFNNSDDKESFEDTKQIENNLNIEEINLEAPNLQDLEKILSKFDSTMNNVRRETRNLGELISEHSFDVDRNKNVLLNGDTYFLDFDRGDPIPTKDLSNKCQSIGLEKDRKIQESAKNDSFKILDFIDSYSTESDDNFVKISTKPSRKKITQPRFSTPLNNSNKNDNGINGISKELSNFFNEIHLLKINRNKERSKNEDHSKIEKENSHLLVEAKNDLAKKKILLQEIEDKCNFKTLFNRDRTSYDVKKKDESFETATFPICSVREKQDIATRSLSQDTALKCEFLTKKNSIRSDSSSRKKSKISEGQYTQSKQVESLRRKSELGEECSVAEESMDKEKNEENLQISVHSEMILETRIPTVHESIKNDSPNEDKVKCHSTEDNEQKRLSNGKEDSKNKNLASSSSGSSLRDRTSYDISTAYSEDFEEPTASLGKSKVQEKIDPLNNLPVEEIPPKNKDPDENNVNTDKSEVKISSRSIKSKTGRSKKETDYLEKSFSSTHKTNQRDEIIENDQIHDSVHSILESQIPNKKQAEGSIASSVDNEKILSREKESPGFSIKKKEETILDLEKKEEKLSRNEESLNSAIKSTKIPSTSSEEDNFHQDKTKSGSQVSIINLQNGEKFNRKGENPDSFVKLAEILSTSSQSNKLCMNDMKTPIQVFTTDSKNGEKLSKKDESVNSSIISEKISSSSETDEPHHNNTKAETCVDNYSEGELYLPSSCSYSLGEIRISELGTCVTSAPGVESSLTKTEGVRIFFSKSMANTDSSNNTINVLGSPIPSLGEVQETDIESTNSKHSPS